MPYANPEDRRKSVREWMRKRRAFWMRGAFCAHCRSTENLQLDHIVPGEKVSHRIWSWSFKRQMEEMLKCQWLCEQCHKLKTKTQLFLSRSSKHGRRAMYNRGCRCKKCTRVCAEYTRNRRKHAR